MLVYFAILLIALLGFCGLVVDVGRVELRSLQLQAAADSAALSAAAEYQRSGSSASAMSAGTADIATNAALNNYPTPSVAGQIGATSGYYQNDGSTIQVKVTQPVSTTLLSIIKGSHSTINASATAVAMIPPCIYLMGHPSISSRANTNLNLSSQGFSLTCPIYTSTGYYVDGFSYIHQWQAKAAGPPSQTYGGGSESPAVVYNSPALPDPLAYITAPTWSTCDHMNLPLITAPTTLTHGVYCGGLKATNTTITMSPGTYIITGTVDFKNTTINGTGVTIYLTKGGGSGFGSFHLETGSTMLLSAPTDGSAGGIPGILLMTDRAWTGTEEDISFDQSSMKGDGILYITGTGIYNWQTAMSGYRYFGFVAANFFFHNAGITFSCDYSQLPGGNPFRTVISLVQ